MTSLVSPAICGLEHVSLDVQPFKKKKTFPCIFSVEMKIILLTAIFIRGVTVKEGRSIHLFSYAIQGNTIRSRVNLDRWIQT